MAKIYISDLANVLVEKHKVSKSMAQLFLTSIVSCIQDGISDDKVVKIKGLGTFKVIDVDARESVDVNTGERVVIESHQKLSFVPDTQLKNQVNKPFSQFETTVLNEGVTFDEMDATQETEAEEKPVVEPAEEEPVEILIEEEPVLEIVEEEVAEPVVAEEPAAVGCSAAVGPVAAGPTCRSIPGRSCRFRRPSARPYRIP